MIHKIIKLHRSLSIEIKTIIGIIIFAILIVGIERYQISENIFSQFIESKKSKNLLLVNTIAPILSLNISLGLESANKEYMDYIARENPDLTFIEIKNTGNKTLYCYALPNEDRRDHSKEREYIDFCNKNINDAATEDMLGVLHLHFSDSDYQNILTKNRWLTLKIFFMTLVLLSTFVYLIRKEFKYLNTLSENVLSYDPKLNNFSLTTTERQDEVGVIHNAIISMVEKIGSYTKILDDVNLSLEDKIKERTRELQEANKQLKALTVTDELTGLSNRRHFEEYFHNSWDLAKRKGVGVSIIMCDIDYFKKVNDTYGHQAGDEVLKKVAAILKKSLKRGSDFVARYGGEEFIIVLHETNLDVAEELCKRVQENLKNSDDFMFDGKKIGHVTMSFGVSCTIPKRDDNSEHLIKLADDALYKAKRSGRNCIVTS